MPGSVVPQISGLVDRMQRIVDQLRLFGRNDPDQVGAFEMQDALRNAVTMIQHTADAAGVKVTLDLPEHSAMTTGQATRFEQVIVNLARNAVDAIGQEPDGWVRITMGVGTDVVIEVSVNGPGLGDLRMEDLIEPFFSTKPSGEGMGLGLAISAQIINEMGGTLEAHTSDDGGAIFRITLPKVGSHD